jgi:hypothetical protein
MKRLWPLVALVAYWLLLSVCLDHVANAQIVSPIPLPLTSPATGSLPNGAPPQIIGYSATNTPESETVVGDMTFARTGVNQYTSTVTKINGAPIGGLATLNAGTGFTTTATTLNLAPVTIPLGGTGTTTPPTTSGQLLISQSTSAYAPVTLTGDGSITSAGVLTVTKINGIVPGGTCSAGTYVTALSTSAVPTCTAAAIAGVPTGTAPQFVGYTAAGAPEAETLGGGSGACSFTRTGISAYALNCNYASSSNPTFTGTVTMSTLNFTNATGSSNLTMGSTSTFIGPDGGNWTSTGINDPVIKATSQFIFPDGATWTTAGLNNGTHLGVGQAAGTDPIDITGNNNSATKITVLNNNTGTSAAAELLLSNGTNTTYLAQEGSANSLSSNNAVLWSDQGIDFRGHNTQQTRFYIDTALLGYWASNGLHLQVAPLEIASGGTGTATAPTVGQTLVATSATTYAPTTLATTNLSDIQTGTWTPDLQFNGSNTGVTYVSRSGNWMRIGKYYLVTFSWVTSALGSAASSSPATICGLPDTAAPVNEGWQGLFALVNSQGINANGGVGVMIGNNSNCLQMVWWGPSTNSIINTLTKVAFVNASGYEDGNFWYVGN